MPRHTRKKQRGGANEFGPDTKTLLRRVAASTTRLDVAGLNITSLPPLPAGLQHLVCWNTRITTLPPLPPSLNDLLCEPNPNLRIHREAGETISEYNARWEELRSGQPPPPRETRNVVRGTTNAISYENLANGNLLTNFKNTDPGANYESKWKRYYTNATYKKLQSHPFTRKPINKNSVRRYAARVVGGRSVKIERPDGYARLGGRHTRKR